MDQSNEVSQFSLKLRKSVRQQIASRARATGMTMRGFVLYALKAQGLDVHDTDINGFHTREYLREETAA